ncbi:Alcohol dehydrogenase GroES-like domain [Propionibacterium ruminifibrarum]|uniref:Alcohol dehydrogenase GroES-like domain n=1 Tax=Propionibacterium ruminifibrarum TaxID=1962131 RepID=A0A375HZP5_9ACTN|nr:zinc-dependent alcohol dehydrogenase family protein [Propionibacterium ruminifibrarum]SPF67231.1 Alcohol dehydrogenase GroES-like domain [Propionibacterium ruminifibrarum]
MRAAVFVEPGTVRVEDRPEPVIEKPTDVIVRVTDACVCGSDLWWFRGISHREHGSLTGHEAMGVVTETGSEVSSLVPGDFVIVPFTHGCGTCSACQAGFDANCRNGEPGGNAGYQAEYMRAYNADGALVKVPGAPGDYSAAMRASLLTLSDVMATGYHAARMAEVGPGVTAVVLGDGAVGLMGVLSARLLGAERIISMSGHDDRAALAREFGATDVVPERGTEAVARVMELTEGGGAGAVLECVGTNQSTQTAIAVARPGAVVGRVGVPHDVDIDAMGLFWRNIGLRGGPASVTTYDRQVLLDAVLDGLIDPGRVFTAEFDLDDVQEAYRAMDERRAVKSLLHVSDS